MKLPIQNTERKNLIRILRKKARENNANIWRKVAEFLEKPKRRRVAVNLSRINRYTKEGDVVVVPGKALSAGTLTHSVTVAAFSFSEKAKEKIEKAGGRCLKIEELLNQNPKGSNIKVIA
jgi:large subunit ribosomal protein L18e